jgi:DNA glycosylase AlkZ-like
MPTKPLLPQPQATLTLRELNRATLARQMLLERHKLGTVEAVERLAGLQAQYSPSPYIGLWTRLEGFTHDELTGALLSKQVVKASMMRWTLHIVSARDYPFFTRAVTESRVAGWGSIASRNRVDSRELHEALLDFATEPRTQEEIIDYLNSQVPHNPDRDRRELWFLASGHGWLVHTPPSGTWRYFGKNSYISAHEWLGEQVEPSLEEAMLALVRRYLAAFGPASRADIMQWAGGRKISLVDAALQRLGDQLVAFKDENGTTLYDLGDAPRPGDVATPVRFLPKWDNLLLAHDNRERVLPNRYRKTIIKVNGDVLPTFLINGVVAGTWSAVRRGGTAALKLESLESLDYDTISALEEEGYELIRFIEPDASNYAIESLT